MDKVKNINKIRYGQIFSNVMYMVTVTIATRRVVVCVVLNNNKQVRIVSKTLWP